MKTSKLQIQSLLFEDQNSKKFFRKNLRLAIAAHLGFFIFCALWFWSSTPRRLQIPPSIRVDLVGLPDFKKSEVLERKLVEAEKASRKALQELMNKPVAEPAEKEKTVSLKKTEKPIKIGPKKDLQKNSLKSAIDRIRALKNLEDTNVKGNLVHKGNAVNGSMNENIDAFGEAMRQKILVFWDLPLWLSQKQLSAQIVVKLDARGYVIGTKFEKPSGNEQFDNYVLKTLQQAQPFGAPPAEIVSSGVLLGFPL